MSILYTSTRQVTPEGESMWQSMILPVPSNSELFIGLVAEYHGTIVLLLDIKTSPGNDGTYIIKDVFDFENESYFLAWQAAVKALINPLSNIGTSAATAGIILSESFVLMPENTAVDFSATSIYL